LGRPGGNITGFSFIDARMLGKWLEVLKEIAPSVKRTMLVFNPQTAPYYPAFVRDLEEAAATAPVELSAMPVREAAEIEAAASAVRTRQRSDRRARSIHKQTSCDADRPGGEPSTPGLLWHSAFRQGRRADLIRARHARYRPSPGFIHRSRPEGERPGDLRVQAPTKYELLIKTAKALGLTVTLRMRADQAIG
jgi:putative tryptophan/tyrosine transport system substrate-binding protein